MPDQCKIFYMFPRRQALHAFLNAASACAYELLDASTYINDELPGLRLTDAQRLAITGLCDSFSKTQRAVCSDLAGMPHLYSFNFAGCRLCINRIMDAIMDDMKLMRSVTTQLEEDGADLAYMLLAETGTHLLASFDQVQDAAAALLEDIH